MENNIKIENTHTFDLAVVFLVLYQKDIYVDIYVMIFMHENKT
jgi:hypothetical protein